MDDEPRGTKRRSQGGWVTHAYSGKADYMPGLRGKAE